METRPREDELRVADVEQGIAELRAILRLDGADLVVVHAENQSVYFRLEVQDASCGDCVLPRDRIEDLIWSRLKPLFPDIQLVTIDDPRESVPPAALSNSVLRLRLPKIEFRHRATKYAERLSSLRGARIGLLDGWGDQETGQGMYPTLAHIARVLTERFEIDGVVWEMKPSTSKEVPDSVLRAFASQVDAVVNGEGICGSCTAATTLDAVLLENLGVPTVTVVQEQFADAARMHATVAGLPNIPLFVEPEPDDGSSVQRLAAQLVEANIDVVVQALTRPVSELP